MNKQAGGGGEAGDSSASTARPQRASGRLGSRVMPRALLGVRISWSVCVATETYAVMARRMRRLRVKLDVRLHRRWRTIAWAPNTPTPTEHLTKSGLCNRRVEEQTRRRFISCCYSAFCLCICSSLALPWNSSTANPAQSGRIPTVSSISNSTASYPQPL